MRTIDLSGLDGTVCMRADVCPVRLDWVRVDRLLIDDSYQRPIERRGRANIQRIAANFRWDRFSPLLVAELENGFFAIIDGQHRAHAAALCGLFTVPVMIATMTRREQAAAFAAVNGAVTALTPSQIFRAGRAGAAE